MSALPKPFAGCTRSSSAKKRATINRESIENERITLQQHEHEGDFTELTYRFDRKRLMAHLVRLIGAGQGIRSLDPNLGRLGGTNA
jgi:hypothetical protein